MLLDIHRSSEVLADTDQTEFLFEHRFDTVLLDNHKSVTVLQGSHIYSSASGILDLPTMFPEINVSTKWFCAVRERVQRVYVAPLLVVTCMVLVMS